jgi:hypothetical protein
MNKISSRSISAVWLSRRATKMEKASTRHARGSLLMISRKMPPSSLDDPFVQRPTSRDRLRPNHSAVPQSIACPAWWPRRPATCYHPPQNIRTSATREFSQRHGLRQSALVLRKIHFARPDYSIGAMALISRRLPVNVKPTICSQFGIG